MGVLTMGSQGGNSSNGKQSQFQPLTQQNSMYSLTLDEVQNQLGDLGKPLSNMNLDELLKTVWTAEANHTGDTEFQGAALADRSALQRQASLTLTRALSKKTVDEVWRDIQQSKNNEERKSRVRQPTLGEITLEDFLVKAGIVTEATSEIKGNAPVSRVDSNIAPEFSQHNQWLQYSQSQPQYQPAQQSMMAVYTTGQVIPPPLHVGPGPVMDVSYPENLVALPSPLMGTLSDSQTPGRKRGPPEDMIEKTVERRHKRMIKNRESAARSRARKQAYTNELENKVSLLEEENERLRKRKELETMLSCPQPPEPKFQLRRTTSAPL